MANGKDSAAFLFPTVNTALLDRHLSPRFRQTIGLVTHRAAATAVNAQVLL